MSKLLVIAAGGTGGHMFPAQALAEEMLRRGWRVKLSTDPRGARYAGGFPEAVEIVEVSSATPNRGGFSAKLGAPFKILRGALAARKAMKADRPDVVAGFGGYPALPAMMAAIMLKVPRLIHEQNGVLGRVNKLFAKRVQTVACGTWPTVLPDGVEAVHIGNPVRETVLAKAGADYIAPGDWPMSVLVIGGSQGARILAETVPKAIALLPEALKTQVRVSQQARDADAELCAQAYATAGITAEIEPFFDDVPQRLSECQLVISRAGASSIADISVIGRPSILVPLGIATDDHQTANAKGLVNAGAAVLIPEPDFTPRTLATHMQSILSDTNGAGQMARTALSLSKPQAAAHLADLVEIIGQTT